MLIPLGEKARAILQACTTEPNSPHRSIAWQALEEQFSAKAIRRKTEELNKRGYLSQSQRSDRVGLVPVEQSWLTDKGRQTLETLTMRG